MERIANASLEREDCGGEELPKELATIDVLEATERREPGDTTDQADIVDQQRAVDEAQAVVDTDVVPDSVLELHELQRRWVLEADVVHVQHGDQPGLELRGETDVQDAHARVHEVRLAFLFAAAEARQQAEAVYQHDVRPREPDALALPEAERPTGEVRVVEDGVEPTRYPVGRVAITRRPECGSLEAQPVAVV